ncbi:hypothetical protein JCM10450v2_003892 [Rhodotorula kratochvilovae]
MIPPLVSSAHLAQQLLGAASPSRPPSRPRSFSATSGKQSLVEDAYDDSASDLSDLEDSDDDGASLIDERFLDPLSPEAIFMKAIAYSRVLSPVGAKFALDMPLRVLAVATGFSESLNSDIHTLRALDGHRELAISHSRLTLPVAEDVAAFLARREREDSPSPELPPARSFQALSLGDDVVIAPHPLANDVDPIENIARRVARHRARPAAAEPPAVSGTATPAERASHEATSARAFGDALLSNLSSQAATPTRARSPSPRARPAAAATTQTREELLEWYQFTAAGQHRHSTALDRLLEGVQAARGASEEGDALPRPPVSVALEGGAPTLRVAAAEGGEEFVFELVEEEEVEEEAEQAGDAEAEAAEHEHEEVERREAARRRLARGELVGR